MKRLETFFENPLLDDEISISNFKKFSEDHLARITANPGPVGGPVAGLAGPTGAAHLNYFGNITDVEVASAVQQGITVGVNNKEREFIDLVKHQEANIVYVFGKASPAYQEFYPHGLMEYTRAGKDVIEMLMERYKAAVTNNPHPNVPATLADELDALHDDYQELRSAQLGKKGKVGTERAERDAARTALANQLWKNILTISLTHLGNVEACMAYFDQSILTKSGASDEEPTEGEGGDTPPTP